MNIGKHKRFILLLAILMLFQTIPVFASKSNTKVILDGKELKFDKDSGHPKSDETGKAAIPLRKLAESIGYEVGFKKDNKNTYVTLKDQKAQIEIKNNGEEINIKEIDNKHKTTRLTGIETWVIEGRTYIDQTFIREVWGMSTTIDQNGNNYTLTIEGKPDYSIDNENKTGHKTQKPSNEELKKTEQAMNHLTSSRGLTVKGRERNEVREEFYIILNDYRTSHGKCPITVSPVIESYAGHRAIEEAHSWSKDRTIDHDRVPGEETELGENVLARYDLSAKALFDQWRNSPGHNKVMLWDDGDQYKVGLSVVEVISVEGIPSYVAVLNMNPYSLLDEPSK